MSKSRIASTDILRHLFNSTPPPWKPVLEISLHTARPGNRQADSEATYGGYARLKITRSTENWKVEGDSASNLNDLDFPPCKDGKEELTHIGIGSNGMIIHIAEMDEPLTAKRRTQPIIAAGELVIKEA